MIAELSGLDPVGLHTRSTSWLVGLEISPFEGKAKPRAVALERVIIDNDANIRSLVSDLGDLCRVGAETWLAMQPLGSAWTDAVAQEHWTSLPPIK